MREELSVGWTQKELTKLAKETGMTICEKDFKTVLYSFDHIESIEREIRKAGERILLEVFRSWRLRD